MQALEQARLYKRVASQLQQSQSAVEPISQQQSTNFP